MTLSPRLAAFRKAHWTHWSRAEDELVLEVLQVLRSQMMPPESLTPSPDSERDERPDFEELRARRNASVQAQMQKLADEYGVPLQSLRSNFNPHACYCACPEGPCEHNWTGPEWVSEDGCACSVTCARCASTAMSHSLRTGP
jgi:hypothetical protein